MECSHGVYVVGLNILIVKWGDLITARLYQKKMNEAIVGGLPSQAASDCAKALMIAQHKALGGLGVCSISMKHPFETEQYTGNMPFLKSQSDATV